MGSRAVVVAAVVATVAVGGCVATAGREMDPADIRTIKAGVTTKDQIRAMFGEPQHRNIQPDGTEVWQYGYGTGGWLPMSMTGQSVGIIFKANVVNMCQTGAVKYVGGLPQTLSVPCDRM